MHAKSIKRGIKSLGKKQFSQRNYSNNSLNNATKYRAFGIAIVSISFFVKNISCLVISY